MIYNKEPILVMWDMVKSLKDEIAIYKEAMNEDEDSAPESYLILESEVDDYVEDFADNKPRQRKSECNFLLVSKGFATNTNDLHNLNKTKISQALEESGFVYEKRNIGYVDGLNSTQHSWSGTINYILNKGEKK